MGSGGVQNVVFCLWAGTTILIAPTCGEVWNQKLGNLLHAIFLTIIKEVKQALHLTSWILTVCTEEFEANTDFLFSLVDTEVSVEEREVFH